jgi:hypothetical protein
MAARAAIAGLVLAASVSAAVARGDVSGRGGFFDQASRSIDHDKKVLKRLESHPLSKASGWTIKETQGSDKVGEMPRPCPDCSPPQSPAAARRGILLIRLFDAYMKARAHMYLARRFGGLPIHLFVHISNRPVISLSHSLILP